MPGIAGHIGAGRLVGFSIGSAPYVSFYDDDDTVDIRVIDDIIDQLESDSTIDAVCTNERVVHNGITYAHEKSVNDRAILRLRQVQHIHHLVVLRRSTLNKYLHFLSDWPDLCEYALWATMVKAGCRFQWMADFGYTWVMHEQNAKSMNIKPAQASVDIIKEVFSA